MTREQTIEKLKTLYTNAVAAMLRADACDDDESAKVMTEYAETLDSAINALETALQTDGDCDDCKHGYFGDEKCDNCCVRYPNHYERRTDERDKT